MDQVNIKVKNLPVEMRRKLNKEFSYFLPHAKYSPAYRMKRWDGRISLFSVGGDTYLQLLPKIYDILIENGYDVSLEDKRPIGEYTFDPITNEFFKDILWPIGHRLEGQPITLHENQTESINTFLSNSQGICELATGFGKTIVCAVLSKSVEKYGRSVIVVPSKDLVLQTEIDYKLCGLDVGVYFGDRKELGHTHTIVTWQSLLNTHKKTQNGNAIVDMDTFFDGVECLILDEVHLLTTNKLVELFAGRLGHIGIRWGLTGTIPKDELSKAHLLCTVGQTMLEISARQLQEDGILSHCKINIEIIQDKTKFVEYSEEVDFITHNDEYNKHWAKKIMELSQTGNTLVLVGRIDAGKAIHKLIPNSVFLSGSVAVKKRKKEYSEMNISDGNVIICSAAIAKVGLNIPRIFNLVLICPGKSFTSVIQSIGRGLRRASDKDFVQIFDLSPSTTFNKKHLKQRIKYYDDAQYPHTTTKISLGKP